MKIGVVATFASANGQPVILSVLGREGASDIRAFVSADCISWKKAAPDIYLLAMRRSATRPCSAARGMSGSPRCGPCMRAKVRCCGAARLIIVSI